MGICGQLIVKICTTGVVKEPWVERTGFVWVQVYAISKIFQKATDCINNWLDQTAQGSWLGLWLQCLGWDWLVLKWIWRPDMRFSFHSRKEGTAGLLISPLSKHISVNNLQKQEIWHKLRAREMKKFASIVFSRWWKCPDNLWNTSFSMKYLDNNW